MAAIKSYTDISQSKKLVEILPLESADMRYGYIAPYDYSDRMYDGGYDEIPYPKDFLIKNPNFSANEYDAELPCWSLASLLSVIKDKCGYFEFVYLKRTYDRRGDVLEDVYRLSTDEYDVYNKEALDACVAMIEKLKELNLL